MAALYCMITEYEELLAWAETNSSSRDYSCVEKWLSGKADKYSAVDDLAIFLAISYIDAAIAYNTASNLFNQIMSDIEFSQVPEVFWRMYIAFEDFEILEDPDALAKPRIRSELEALNAI